MGFWHLCLLWGFLAFLAVLGVPQAKKAVLAIATKASKATKADLQKTSQVAQSSLALGQMLAILNDVGIYSTKAQ